MAAEKRTVVVAVAITATVSLAFAGLIAYFVYRLAKARRSKKDRNGVNSSFRREPATGLPCVEFGHRGRALRGVIVDEEGMDVLYLSRFDGRVSDRFTKFSFNNPLAEEEELKRMDSRKGVKPMRREPIQEVPLLEERIGNGYDFGVKNSVPPAPPPPLPPPPQSPRSPPSPPPPPRQIPRSPPSPPPPPRQIPRSPPSPPPPRPPPPPPGPSKVKAIPPAPPAKKSLIAQQKPPIPPNGIAKMSMKSKNSSLERENEGVERRLKPLHWDKVIANADHSMVWNEINDGSFRFDDDLIESLFGYSSTGQKPAQKGHKSSGQGSSTTAPPPRIFLLDPRKSQNTAIILKSLPVSRKAILDSLNDGLGLSLDTLEKLTKICPTQDETSAILQFSGNPTNLADAESFLHYILKSVPSAFVRFNAMLFRSSYDPEVLHLKECLQTLELGCKELRTGGIFFKLLEAVLRAGNRMNAGTARGDAQGFNLTALQKLADVKSSDGKTTLLHVVVEQVTRSEGKRRRLANRKNKEEEEERDREYEMQLGLPSVAKLSAEFSNVNKAAALDYENFIKTRSVLTSRVNESRQLLTHCREEDGRFLQEMKGFLEGCEEELKVMSEEETRILEVMRRTTIYYQAGAFQDKGTNPLQLFVVVKDFLVMVDQACAEISKNVQRRKVMISACPSPPSSPSPTMPRSPMRFQNMEAYLMSQNRGGNSSDSEDDF